MVWMALEAAVAIAAGVLARSVLLTAFGLGSVIELISGGLLIWRLAAEARATDPERIETVERRAARVSTLLLILLCAYVLATSVAGLLTHLEPAGSLTGIVIASSALVVMPLLAWRKHRINQTLASAALGADIAETVTCAAMAGTTLAGLALDAGLGWWWAEYVAALALLLFIGHESWEALEEARSR